LAEPVRHPEPVLKAGEDWRKIEQPGCKMLTERCRSVFMQFGRWIVI
jgi:hypothetical protein